MTKLAICSEQEPKNLTKLLRKAKSSASVKVVGSLVAFNIFEVVDGLGVVVVVEVLVVVVVEVVEVLEVVGGESLTVVLLDSKVDSRRFMKLASCRCREINSNLVQYSKLSENYQKI